MATEYGVVTETAGATAWVTTRRSSACESCSSRGSCMSEGGSQEMRVQVDNPVRADVGDRVLIHLHTGSLLKATFLLYVIPILCMLAGAGAGQWLGTRYGLDPNGAAVGFGIAALLIGVAGMRRKANALAQRADYRPAIVRVLGPDVSYNGS